MAILLLNLLHIVACRHSCFHMLVCCWACMLFQDHILASSWRYYMNLAWGCMSGKSCVPVSTLQGTLAFPNSWVSVGNLKSMVTCILLVTRLAAWLVSGTKHIFSCCTFFFFFCDCSSYTDLWYCLCNEFLWCPLLGWSINAYNVF